MSWNIALIENTLVINQECAKEIESLIAENEWPVEYGAISENDDGTIGVEFDHDHMEHMDFLRSSDVALETLLKHSAEGDILFGSLDGDDFGSFWGYRFSNGKMTRLVGEISWSEVD